MTAKNLAKWQVEALELAIKRAKFERANFDTIGLHPDEYPTQGNQVDAFVKARTKMYREAWLVPLLEAILAGDRETAGYLK